MYGLIVSALAKVTGRRAVTELGQRAGLARLKALSVSKGSTRRVVQKSMEVVSNGSQRLRQLSMKDGLDVAGWASTVYIIAEELLGSSTRAKEVTEEVTSSRVHLRWLEAAKMIVKASPEAVEEMRDMFMQYFSTDLDENLRETLSGVLNAMVGPHLEMINSSGHRVEIPDFLLPGYTSNSSVSARKAQKITLQEAVYFSYLLGRISGTLESEDTLFSPETLVLFEDATDMGLEEDRRIDIAAVATLRGDQTLRAEIGRVFSAPQTQVLEMLLDQIEV